VVPPPAGVAPAPAPPADNLESPPLDAPAPVPLRWPYFDMEYGGLELGNRYQSYGIVWAHVGVYPWSRLHLTARIGVAQADIREQTEESPPPGFSGAAADDEDLPGVYGNLGLGYVLSSSGSFVFAPSLTLHLSENSDYGYGAGVMIPFVWVTRRGFRIGFEASLMRAFGGSIRYTCTATQVDAPCDAGEVREFNRAPGSGFSAGFLFGYAVD